MERVHDRVEIAPTVADPGVGFSRISVFFLTSSQPDLDSTLSRIKLILSCLTPLFTIINCIRFVPTETMHLFNL